MYSGVSTASLFLREMNEDALSILNGLGVRATEIFLTTLSEYTQEFSRLLASRKGNLCVNSVHVLNTQFEPQLFGAHPRAKKDAYDILDTAMSGAAVFGAKYYTFHGITRLKKNSVTRNFAELAQNMKEIDATCAKHGIKLCLENVHWAMYNAPGIFAGIREYFPDLMGVFDVKQARLSCYPYQMYIKEMEGRIAHVHLSDVDECGKICLPGKGTFDFEECFRRLKDAGFDGAALIEVYAGDYGKYEELRRSCDYLDEIIYKIG